MQFMCTLCTNNNYNNNNNNSNLPVPPHVQLSLAIPPWVGELTGDGDDHWWSRDGKFCVIVSPVSRTAGLPSYSQRRWHPAYTWQLNFNSRRFPEGTSSVATDLAIYAEIFFVPSTNTIHREGDTKLPKRSDTERISCREIDDQVGSRARRPGQTTQRPRCLNGHRQATHESIKCNFV